MAQKETSSNLLYGIDDRPPLSRALVYGIQQLMACLGATILVPILVNGGVGDSVLSSLMALFTAGVGTFIFIACTKNKAGIYLGSSFAFISPMIAGFLAGGKAGVFTAGMAVGLIYVIVALIIKAFGNAWIDKVLPPVIIGPAIMIIGLGLAPTAVQSAGLVGEAADWLAISAAAVTLIAIILISNFTKGFLQSVAILLGLIVGYVYSMAVGIVDFSAIAQAPWFSVPRFEMPFVTYKPDFSAMLIIAPLALVTLCEHIGDMTVYSAITGRNVLASPIGLDKTIMGDGLATAFACMIGGVPNTSYGEYTSTVGLSRVASIDVLKITAGLAILVSFFGKFGAVLSTLPSPVLGGACIALYGFIAGNGMKVMIQNQVDLSQTRNIQIVSIMLVLGLGGAAVSILVGETPIAVSGMSLATVIGVLLNAVLPGERRQGKKGKAA